MNPSRSASSTNWARLSDNENAPQKKRRKKKRPTTPLYDPSNFIRSTPIIFESKSSRKISATLDPSPHPFCLQEKKTGGAIHPPPQINTPSTTVCIIASGRATNVKINILTNIGETSSLRTSPVTSNNSSLHRVIVRLVGLTRYLVSGACSNIICPSLSLYTRRNGPSNCPICSNDRIIKSPVFSLFLSFSGVQREKFFHLSFFDGGEEGCLFSTRVSSVFLKVTNACARGINFEE